MGLAQNVFFLTGALMLGVFLTTLFFVKESFTREGKETLRIKDVWNMIPDKSLTVILSVTFFIITLALYSIEPVVTIYVAQLTTDTRTLRC
jgi:MFS transporter, DHA1 family, multidrug resistance protein